LERLVLFGVFGVGFLGGVLATIFAEKACGAGFLQATLLDLVRAATPLFLALVVGRWVQLWLRGEERDFALQQRILTEFWDRHRSAVTRWEVYSSYPDRREQALEEQIYDEINLCHQIVEEIRALADEPEFSLASDDANKLRGLFLELHSLMLSEPWGEPGGRPFPEATKRSMVVANRRIRLLTIRLSRTVGGNLK